MKNSMTKILIAATMMLLLQGCSNNSKGPANPNLPYFEMTKDTAFTYDDTKGERFEIIVKKGTVLELKLVDGQTFELVYGDYTLIADASNAKGVKTIPMQPVPLIISTEPIVVKEGADMVDQDGTVLMQTKTKLPAVNFIRVFEINGANYYEMVVASRVVYINVDNADIILE